MLCVAEVVSCLHIELIFYAVQELHLHLTPSSWSGIFSDVHTRQRTVLCLLNASFHTLYK